MPVNRALAQPLHGHNETANQPQRLKGLMINNYWDIIELKSETLCDENIHKLGSLETMLKEIPRVFLNVLQGGSQTTLAGFTLELLQEQ